MSKLVATQIVMVLGISLMALVAVGFLLTIKILRGRQASQERRPTSNDVGSPPAAPMSVARAQRWRRRYGAVFAVVLTLFILAAVLLPWR
jgi:hypothetical protein